MARAGIPTRPQPWPTGCGTGTPNLGHVVAISPVGDSARRVREGQSSPSPPLRRARRRGDALDFGGWRPARTRGFTRPPAHQFGSGRRVWRSTGAAPPGRRCGPGRARRRLRHRSRHLTRAPCRNSPKSPTLITRAIGCSPRSRRLGGLKPAGAPVAIAPISTRNVSFVSLLSRAMSSGSGKVAARWPRTDLAPSSAHRMGNSTPFAPRAEAEEGVRRSPHVLDMAMRWPRFGVPVPRRGDHA